MAEAGFPAPLVRHRDPFDHEVPAAAERMKRVALDNGWTVYTQYAKGYHMGNDGKPTHLTVRTPLTDEATGEPVLSPTGRPRFTETETDELRVVESLLLRCTRDRDRRQVAVTWLDGKFNGPARTLDGKFLTANRMRDYLREA